MISSDPIRVLLVDDHPLLLRGLELLINGQRPRMEVAGIAERSSQVLTVVSGTRVDVVLLDLSLGAEDGMALIAPLKAQPHPPAILIFTAVTDPAVHRELILAGACGVITKTQRSDTVLKAIEHAAQGQLWLDRSLSTDVIQTLRREAARPRADGAKSPLSTLTERERQIAARVTAEPGASARALAKSLGISEHTVRNHLAAIYAKLGVSSRIELLDWVHRKSLTDSGDKNARP